MSPHRRHSYSSLQEENIVPLVLMVVVMGWDHCRGRGVFVHCQHTFE